MYLTSEKYKVIIIYNYKCGWTTLRSFFVKMEEMSSDPNSVIQNVIQDNYGYFPENHHDYKKIMLVRNPYDRLISYYINKVVGHVGFSDSFIDHMIFPIVGYKNFRDLYIPLRNYSFQSFLLLLTIIKPECWEAHFKRQVDSIVKDIKVDQIFKLENLDEMELFFKELGVTEEATILLQNTMNSSGLGHTENEVEFKDEFLPINLIKYRTTREYMVEFYEEFLSDQSKELIYHLYKEDFELGGYEP